jgi:hypothetical protein
MITRRHLMSLSGTSALGFSVASRATGAPQSATVDSPDPLSTQPYVDIDEWRDTPVRYRYVHGEFKGTDARFSFYFPPKEQYQGRFFQPLSAVLVGSWSYSESPPVRTSLVAVSHPSDPARPLLLGLA